ncbi:hypothetical protein [uncultured Brevibacillus sp.]|uniref:hypothetical protein n=1 Tax=uncultured Brevibacillus sp. TaxID=169970 RepID=UPI0025955CED|nr:hypothetical protein [uncultured Brevibacillus sp.]
MDETKWLEQLKERADRTVMRDVQFTSAMEERVRQKIRKKADWRPLLVPIVAAIFCLIIWQALPKELGNDQAAKPGTVMNPAPSLLPGGVLETPVLWKPSTPTKSTYQNQTFTYLGEKPVRVITDEKGFYEGQAQRVTWLLDEATASTVEIVAYSSEGSRVPVGTFQVMAPLFDAKGHFPMLVALPDPGIWKLQALSEGKHLGQVFVQVQDGISPANRSLVEPLIFEFLNAEGKKLGWLGPDRKVEVELLGVDAPNAENRTVYAWVKILGEAHSSSGISSPMVFSIAYNGNKYRVTGFQIPGNGSEYQSSMKKLFPPKILEKLRNR